MDLPLTMLNNSFFCSWSGGKDCCLALYRHLQMRHKVDLLLTMMCEDGLRSRSHGLSAEILRHQSNALGIPWIGMPASWACYEQVFLSTLQDLHGQGYRYGIFGDIDLEEHLIWVQKVCQNKGIVPFHPLWKQQRRDLLQELLSARFDIKIIAVKEGVLDPSFLGQSLTPSVIMDFEQLGIDLCGEKGEYHTFVVDGPCFAFPVEFQPGEISLRDGVWFLDVPYSVCRLS